MEKLDPPGAMCSNPRGVALEATLDQYSLTRDRAGDISSSPIFERILCCWLVRGALDIPTRVNNYLLDSQSLRHLFPVRTVVHPSHKQQARLICLSPSPPCVSWLCCSLQLLLLPGQLRCYLPYGLPIPCTECTTYHHQHRVVSFLA